MSTTEERRDHLLRFGGVIALMGAAFLFLLFSLWRLQVLRASHYESRFEKQSIRRVRIAAVRGSVFDRNGLCLAGNRPNYCLGIYIEELRQPGKWPATVREVERTLDRAAGVIGRPPSVVEDDIWLHIRRRLPLPFIAWRDLTEAEMARWAAAGASVPAADICVEPVRVYPQGSLAAHAIGYVRRAEPRVDDDGGTYHYYLPDMAGVSGMERALDAVLAGRAGGRLLRVDVSGYRRDESSEREPEPGRSVVLTIDAGIQGVLESQLSGERGAAVVLDPRNGDVLGIASSPGYNLADFSPSISSREFDALVNDTGRPLFNRAVSGQYPPGSTFKPVIAIAALESGSATPGMRVDCPGYFKLGRLTIMCWNQRGHGSLDMRGALEQSCNTYFCQLGLKCGYDSVRHTAEAMGFGRPCGVGLIEESGGLLPDGAWKMRRYGEPWWPGDTANISIGQGALLCTPLQMAMATATIANGGLCYRPRMLRAVLGPGVNPHTVRMDGKAWRPGELAEDLHLSPVTRELVRRGMLDVVGELDGTGARARIPGVTIGGKTGTAEYGPRGARRKYAWMIAFAPYERPRYAVSVVIEDALSGGRTAAPRVARIMEALFSMDGTVAGAVGREG